MATLDFSKLIERETKKSLDKKKAFKWGEKQFRKRDCPQCGAFHSTMDRRNEDENGTLYSMSGIEKPAWICPNCLAEWWE